MTIPTSLLHTLCSLPTAPFVEDHVIAFVEQFAQSRKLKLSKDRWGNLLLSFGPTPRKGQKRLVLTAHMDHPGFVSAAMTEKNTLEAYFRGGVLASFLPPGTKVRFFLPDQTQVLATLVSTQGNDPHRPTPQDYPTTATFKTATPIPPNCPGMFNLTAARVKKGQFHARVCDDLAGAAAALTAMELLRKKKPKLPFAVLLTRAEEVGFVGALAAVSHPELLRKADDYLIAIECSSAQPYAPVGNGVILRVGDRTSIFNSSLTAFLHDTAQSLAKSNSVFKFQRQLMPGGTCESTVYDAWGYHAAAVCLPLGHYHNMDKANNKLAPEFISVADYQSMVTLFVALARSAHSYVPGHLPLKARLTARFQAYRHLLNA